MNVVPHRRPAPGISLHGLLERAVRPEFRKETIVFDAEERVFGSSTCKVASCRRHARGNGLCTGHHLRWRAENRPDLEEFVATTDARWKRERPNLTCELSGLHYGTARQGLCQLHAQRWQRAGCPDRDVWLSEPQDFPRPPDGVTERDPARRRWVLDIHLSQS